MIIYGVHPVLEALESSNRLVRRVLVTRGKSNPRLQQIIDLARQLGVSVHFEPLKALDRRAASNRHQDVVAELSAVPYSGLSEILESRPSMLMILDGVEDPRNLGAVIRTAEAAGVGAVLLPERHNCGITPTVVQASAGGALHIRICRVGNLVQTLDRLREAGYWLVGLDLEGTEDMDRIDASLPLALVVGGEHRGLRRLVREHCDWLVRIPMRGKVASLNLSVAAAVLLYSIVLKRTNRSVDPPRTDSADSVPIHNS